MKDRYIVYRKGAKDGEEPYQLVEITRLWRRNRLFVRHGGKLWPVIQIGNKKEDDKTNLSIDDLKDGCMVFAIRRLRAFDKRPIRIGPLDIRTIEKTDYFHDEIHTKHVFKITTEGNKDPITLVETRNQLYIEMEENRTRHQYPIVAARSPLSSIRGGHVTADWLKPGNIITFNMGGHHDGTLPPIKKVKKLTPTEALIEQGGL